MLWRDVMHQPLQAMKWISKLICKAFVCHKTLLFPHKAATKALKMAFPRSEASTSIIPLKNNCRGDKGLIHSLSCFLHKICYLGPLPNVPGRNAGPRAWRTLAGASCFNPGCLHFIEGGKTRWNDFLLAPTCPVIYMHSTALGKSSRPPTPTPKKVLWCKGISFRVPK